MLKKHKQRINSRTKGIRADEIFRKLEPGGWNTPLRYLLEQIIKYRVKKSEDAKKLGSLIMDEDISAHWRYTEWMLWGNVVEIYWLWWHKR